MSTQTLNRPSGDLHFGVNNNNVTFNLKVTFGYNCTNNNITSNFKVLWG